MECKYCGKEINSEALVCKYCKEYLGEGEDTRNISFMLCPSCSSEIREGAKVCRFCRDEIGVLPEAQGPARVIEIDHTISQNNKVVERKEKVKLGEFLIDLIKWGLIVGLCFLAFRSCSSGTINIDTSSLIVDTIDDGSYKIQTDSDGEPSLSGDTFGDISINPVENGYETIGEISGHNVRCLIKDIEGFVNKIEKGKVLANNCSFVENFDKMQDLSYDDDFAFLDDLPERNVGIFFDNSYANNGDKKYGPNNRIKELKKYLTSGNFSDGTSFTFVIPYGDGKELQGARIDPDEKYEIRIDKSRFPLDEKVLNNIYYSKSKDSGGGFIKYIKQNKTLHIYDYSISFATSGNYSFYKQDTDGLLCDTESGIELSGGDEDKKFVCYDAENVFKKFFSLYTKNYMNDSSKHRGNLLLNALKQHPYNEWNDLYIFSDGEFEIGDGWTLTPSIKKFIRDSKVNEKTLSELPLTNFHADLYQYYDLDDTYKTFWNKTIDRIKKNQIKKTCLNTDIHLIGFTPAFGGYDKEIYQKIFDNCTIFVNK